jgi:hypothetical protein
MGFQNDKSGLVEQIGVFKVIAGTPKIKKTNSMDSINSKSKNLLPFLMDILQAANSDAGGRNQAKNDSSNLLSELLTTALPDLTRVVKEGLIQAIKAGLACGTDFTIPTPTPTFTVPINKLDLTDMLKMDPNGPAGLLFGSPSRDFNRFLLDIVSNQSNGTWEDKNGRALAIVTYNTPTPTTNNLPTVTIKVADSTTNYNRGGTSFHDFLVDWTNSIELFSTKNVMGTMMEMAFGSISLANNIGVDTLLSQAKMDKGVDNIHDVDVCADKIVIDNSFYDFGNEELSLMERNANNKSRGVNVMDLGCGMVEVVVPQDILEPLKDLDTASPSLIKDIVEQTISSTSDAITAVGGPTDGPTMALNFNVQSILNMPKMLVRMVVTPKVVSLYQIAHNMVNASPLNVDNGFDFSKFARTFFDFIARAALAAVLKFIFTKIKAALIALITKVVIKIIKEKITIFINSMTNGRVTDAASGAVGNIQPPDTGSQI